jgi:hypothetical protein
MVFYTIFANSVATKSLARRSSGSSLSKTIVSNERRISEYSRILLVEDASSGGEWTLWAKTVTRAATSVFWRTLELALVAFHVFCTICEDKRRLAVPANTDLTVRGHGDEA